MERKNRFTLHIVILSLMLILVDLSTRVEGMKSPLRRRISMRRTDSEDSLLPSIQLNRDIEPNNSVTCALSLAERHLEVCELAWKINQLQELLPHLHKMVTKRLGKREFTFTVYMKSSSSAVQLLGDAGQALLRSLGKFVQFLGYVQKLFDATIGGSQILEESSGRKSLYRKRKPSAFSEEIRDISSVDDDEVHRLIQKAWSRKCALELLKSDKNLCNVINRINLLDALLDSSIADLDDKDSQVLAIKLYSERLNLTDILDAIHDSLVMKMVPIRERGARSDRDPIYLTSIGNNRRLVNKQGQEVKELFETSDFKVELMKKQPQENKGRGILRSRRKLRGNTFFDSEESFPKPPYRPNAYLRQLLEAKDTASQSEEENDDKDDDDYDWSYFDIDESKENKEFEEPEWLAGILKNMGNLSRKTKKHSIVQH